MATITEDLDRPGLDSVEGVTVEIALVDLDGNEITGVHSGGRIIGVRSVDVDEADGTWSADLPANSEITTPGGVATAFKRTLRVRGRVWDADHSLFTVPTGSGTHPLETVTVEQLLPPPPSGANITVPKSWGSRWLAAREEADTRQVKVHIWGDSISQGQGASDQLNLGYAGLVVDALQSAYGDGGSGWLGPVLGTVSGGTATLGMGGCGRRASSTASVTWTDLRGTTIRIYHRNQNISGTYRYRIDGGSFTNVTPPTGFGGTEPGAVEITGLDDVDHTVEVEWISGTVEWFAVEAFYDTGIRPARCAQGGRAAADFTMGAVQPVTVGITSSSPTVTSPAPGVFNSSMEGRYISGTGIPTDTTIDTVTDPETATMSAAATATNAALAATLSTGAPSNPSAVTITLDPFLAPALGRADLVILAYGAAAGPLHSVDAFYTGLSAIINEYTRGAGGDTHDFSPDFVVLQTHLANSIEFASSVPRRLSVAVENAAWAQAMGAAFVDVWGDGRRSFKYWDDLGFLADGIHPSDAGHAHMAQLLTTLLT